MFFNRLISKQPKQKSFTLKAFKDNQLQNFTRLGSRSAPDKRVSEYQSRFPKTPASEVLGGVRAQAKAPKWPKKFGQLIQKYFRVKVLSTGSA